MNKTFNDLVRDAVQQYYSGLGQGSAAAPLRFIPASDIKNYFRELGDNQSSANEDYSSGRYSGLIFNAELKKLCVVYNASSVCPLLGTQTYAEREQAAILAYVAANMMEAYRCLEKKYAILHVASPNAFIKSYHAEPLRSKVNGKRTNNKSPVLSAGYNRFWIVPQTHAGVREYHDLMTKDIEVEQYELLSALRSGLLLKYYVEDRELAADFPLVDSDGTLVAVFPHLECTTLTRMETTVRSKKGKERSFRLLTRPWIVPYLERVFDKVPNVKIESMDDDLPENLTSQPIPSEPVYEMAVEKER